MEFYRETIFILHGWGGSSRSFKSLRNLLLEKGLLVYALDLPGFGGASAPPKPWAVDDYVNFVSNFVLAQKIDKFYLFGHSFGGRIAIKFAVKYPEKLKGLILCSAAGLKPRKTFWQILIFGLAKIGNKFSFCPGYSFFRKIFYKFFIRKTDYLRTKGLMKETFKKVINEDLTSFLSQIKIPSLIIWGRKDKITPISDAYKMNKEIKNSILKIIPEGNHNPHFQFPQKLTEYILEFIAKNKI